MTYNFEGNALDGVTIEMIEYLYDQGYTVNDTARIVVEQRVSSVVDLDILKHLKK